MATKESIAIRRQLAIESLKQTGMRISTLLGIEAPGLDHFYRDKDLHQAEDIKALAEFNERVIRALETRQPEPVAMERIEDGQSSNAKSQTSRRSR